MAEATETARLLIWQPGAERLVERSPATLRLEIADSWLVEEGRARGLDGHRQRFAVACRERCGVPAGALEAFFRAALAAIPRRGRWFPRLECDSSRGAPELRLRLRSAPAPGLSPASVWVPDAADPRTSPRLKGPDLGRLAELRAEAERRGADEALLRHRRGWLLEGALSGLLWWRNEALCLPAARLPVLPSVTAALLQDLVRDRGLPVRRERCRLEEIAGLETWLVSALRGIRPVGRWQGAEIEPAPPVREPAWSRRLTALARPLDELP